MQEAVAVDGLMDMEEAEDEDSLHDIAGLERLDGRGGKEEKEPIWIGQGAQRVEEVRGMEERAWSLADGGAAEEAEMDRASSSSSSASSHARRLAWFKQWGSSKAISQGSSKAIDKAIAKEEAHLAKRESSHGAKSHGAKSPPPAR